MMSSVNGSSLYTSRCRKYFRCKAASGSTRIWTGCSSMVTSWPPSLNDNVPPT
jgi:hypothetical protein